MRLGLRFIHEHQLEARWLGRVPTEDEISRWQEIREIRERLAEEIRLREEDSWMNMDDVLTVSSQGEVQIGDRTLSNADIEKLPLDQVEFIETHDQLVKELHTNLFRFYGFMDTGAGQTKRIDLEVEFIFMAADGDARTKIEKFAYDMGATLSIMMETDTEHGLELQVEVCLNVYGQDQMDVHQVMNRWRKEIETRDLGRYMVSLL